MQLRVEVRSATQAVAQAKDKPSVDQVRARNVVPAEMRSPQPSNVRANADNRISAKWLQQAGVAMRPAMRIPVAMHAPRTAAARPAPMATMQLGPRRESERPAATQIGINAAARRPTQLSLPRSRQDVTQARQPAAQRTIPALEAFRTRSPELVWRASEPKPVDAIDAPHAQGSSAPVAHPVPIAQVETQAIAALQSALRPQALDTALVDRVADDVIRRIDHRLRIERERRGL